MREKNDCEDEENAFRMRENVSPFLEFFFLARWTHTDKNDVF